MTEMKNDGKDASQFSSAFVGYVAFHLVGSLDWKEHYGLFFFRTLDALAFLPVISSAPQKQEVMTRGNNFWTMMNLR